MTGSAPQLADAAGRVARVGSELATPLRSNRCMRNTHFDGVPGDRAESGRAEGAVTTYRSRRSFGRGHRAEPPPAGD